jgi:hypothetical protein
MRMSLGKCMSTYWSGRFFKTLLSAENISQTHSNILAIVYNLGPIRYSHKNFCRKD